MTVRIFISLSEIIDHIIKVGDDYNESYDMGARISSKINVLNSDTYAYESVIWTFGIYLKLLIYDIIYLHWKTGG